MRVEVHASIRAIDAAAWDAVCGPGRVFFSHAFLKLVEESGLNDCRFYYLVFRADDGAMLAHTCAYSMATDLLIFAKGVLKRVVDAVRTVLPGLLRPRILECGCPVGLGNPLSLAPGAPRDEVLDLLARTLDGLAAAEGIRMLVVRDFRAGELESHRRLEAAGYRRIENLPVAELEVRWKTFDAYAAAMRSRYRSKLNRHMKMARTSGLRAEVVARFGDLAEQLARQWRNVFEHAEEYSREQLNPAFYRGLDRDLGPACRVVAIRKGDELVAHSPVLRDGPVLHWLFFGREEPQVRDNAYFLVMATVVRLAIEEGAERVEMGLTTYVAKGEMGGAMVPLFMYLRFRGPVLGAVLPRLHRIFNQVPEVRAEPVFSREAEPDR